MHGGKEANAHEGKKTYKCPLYSLGKDSRGNYKCQASFSNMQGMSLHISKTHLVFKLHKCQFCGSRFNNTFKLKKHTKEVHEGKKALVLQHSCSICIASFKYKKNLQEHIAANHKNPHMCDICDKRFIHIGFLNQHILKKHQGIEAIIDKDQITEVHEEKKGKSPKNMGNKPCKCSGCGATFNSTFSLSMHKRHCAEEKTRDIIDRERMSKSRLKNKSAGKVEEKIRSSDKIDSP